MTKLKEVFNKKTSELYKKILALYDEIDLLKNNKKDQ